MLFNDGGYLKCNWVQGKQDGNGVLKRKKDAEEENAVWKMGELIKLNSTILK